MIDYAFAANKVQREISAIGDTEKRYLYCGRWYIELIRDEMLLFIFRMIQLIICLMISNLNKICGGSDVS